MPLLQTVLEQHKDTGLVVLAINFEESAGLVEPFVSELGLTLEILYDTTATVSKAYHVTGLPTTFFIDRQGVIQHIQIGQLDEDLLDQHLSSILKSP
jgi:peroxiredoxin